jgi:hypothetical protein
VRKGSLRKLEGHFSGELRARHTNAAPTSSSLHPTAQLALFSARTVGTSPRNRRLSGDFRDPAMHTQHPREPAAGTLTPTVAAGL